MSKKVISVVALLFAVLFVFASCEKGSRYGTLIVDEKGMTHVLATDDNGCTMQDKYGNLIEVITDSNKKKPVTVPGGEVTDESGNVSQYEGGEYAVQEITFPSFIYNGDTVERHDYIIHIPDGWTHTGKITITLKNDETGATFDGYKSGEYDSVQEVIDTIEDQRAKLTGEYQYDYEEITICGVKGYKCHYDFGDNQRYLYIFSLNGTVYRFGGTVKTIYDKQTDFEAIINNIEFR